MCGGCGAAAGGCFECDEKDHVSPHTNVQQKDVFGTEIGVGGNERDRERENDADLLGINSTYARVTLWCSSSYVLVE